MDDVCVVCDKPLNGHINKTQTCKYGTCRQRKYAKNEDILRVKEAIKENEGYEYIQTFSIKKLQKLGFEVTITDKTLSV